MPKLKTKSSAKKRFSATGTGKLKRNFRSLWIQRINAATRLHDMTYSRFISGLKKAGIELDRKVLADIALKEPANFAKLVEAAKGALSK